MNDIGPTLEAGITFVEFSSDIWAYSAGRIGCGWVIVRKELHRGWHVGVDVNIRRRFLLHI